jgi:hypothetical protein
MDTIDAQPRARSRRRLGASLVGLVAAPVLGGLGLTACTPPPGCTFNPSGSSVVVGPTQTVCLTNVTYPGAVIVRPGGTLFMDTATVGGSVTSDGASSVTICGSTVKGAVTANRTQGGVVVGFPIPSGPPGSECAPNTIGGAVTLNSNQLFVSLGGNQIAGRVEANNNNMQIVTAIFGNTIRGSLSCTGNNPPPSNFGIPNTVSGARTGQCASL